MTLEILRKVEQQLLSSDSPFETGSESVRGLTMEVFTQRARSLRDILIRSAEFGERTYVVFGERDISYQEHFDTVAACATLLRETYDIQPGDRVAILGANHPEWVIAFWAATSIGALPVGMNAWWVGNEIEYALEDTTPKVIIADDKRRQRFTPPADIPVVRMEQELLEQTKAYHGYSLPEASIEEDDPAAILFSSGTTGRPKGIVATHRNILALVGIQTFHGARVKVYEAALEGRQPQMGEDAPAPKPALVSTPLFHVAGLYAGIITRLATGGTTIWTQGAFEAEQVLALIEHHGIGGWGPTPTMVRRILDHPDFQSFDLSTLEFIGMGGSPVSTELLEEVRNSIPSARLAAAVGYGLTEACALISINYGPELDAHPDSVGRPLPTVDVEIRDRDGEILPDGEVGEICVRSPLVMHGYWSRENETQRSFYPDGWLRTGDLGSMQEGYLYMPARRRDLIIRGGENIYPAEVERVLNNHPAVKESAVYGQDDREYGQIPMATVVLYKDGGTTEDELGDYLSGLLAYFKIPDNINLQTTPLPRNASGKILKRMLESGGDMDDEFAEPDV